MEDDIPTPFMTPFSFNRKEGKKGKEKQKETDEERDEEVQPPTPKLEEAVQEETTETNNKWKTLIFRP